ncbi:trypsin-like peptidase domain-containing protein [Kribbella albertanoniae]|uniref:Serine protease n=1 Tax=Kribbella albertanoniae TaxID=1266829 RepID=A0A4R4QIW7_9ACTN|nr:trypsin-like peptidase domain-containing protein [Kribbella albertanoniae]TDC35540.1 hypothetical protein E1261_01365 [Kribbella albertanoniae]
MPLFLGTGGRREPAFAFIEGEGRRLADMMGFVGPQFASVTVKLMERYEVADLGDVVGSNGGGGLELVCHGYPDLGGGAKWPYAPPSVVNGQFTGINQSGPMIEADMATEKGFSGGPVLMEDGSLAGMLIGDTDGKARIVPRQVLALLGG